VAPGSSDVFEGGAGVVSTFGFDLGGLDAMVGLSIVSILGAGD
jgi:hypothetical protein